MQGNLIGQMYINLLRENMFPKIREIIAEDNNMRYIFFQQYGAPPHYAAPSWQFLDENFRRQWIDNLLNGQQGLILFRS